MRNTFLVITALLAGLTTAAVAQVDEDPLLDEDAEEVVEPIRRYTVELIVFAYAATVSSGNEIWLPDEPAVETTAVNDLFFDEFGERLTEVEVPAIGRRYMDLELALFTKDDFTMNGIYDKLVELEAYEPIVRAGWTQPTYPRDVTASIPIQTLAESPPWLAGELKLYLGRYLHLVVDLTMDEDRSRTAEAEEETAPGVLTFGDARAQQQYGFINEYGDPVQAPIRYRIFEDRIMKNGDIRYFDHPKFGVVAKITRFEEEEEEIIDDTADLLPAS